MLRTPTERLRQSRVAAAATGSLSPPVQVMALLASHDFQTALQNYLDLEDLRRRLERWEHGFAAYDDIIAKRRAYYEPLLPDLDQEFRAPDPRRR